MSNVLQFQPRRRCVGEHHRCPFCGSTDGYVNVGAQSWGICDQHQVKWYIGANIGDEWLAETPHDWIVNAHYLDNLDRIYPDATEEQA